MIATTKPETAAPTRAVDRRYHWQHERLLGIDETRFGSVRWTLDAREQITEAAYSLQHAASEQPQRYQADTVSQSGSSRYTWDACGRMASRTTERPGLRPGTTAGTTSTGSSP